MFDQRQSEQRDSRQDGVNFLMWWLRALAAIGWPFTRKDNGHECPGSCALGTILMLVVLAISTNSFAAWLVLWLWILGLLRLKAKQIQNRKKGIIPHRYWDGSPWLAKLLCPGIRDISNLKAAEGFGVMGIGALLTYADPALGGLVATSGIASICIECFAVQARKNRVGRMREANMEMQQLIDDYENRF